MKLITTGLTTLALAAGLATAAQAAPEDFDLESIGATLSTHQAGGHPDFTTTFELAQDPSSPPNAFGLQRPYATTRNIAIDLPAGLSGNPEAMSEQCEAADLIDFLNPAGGGCPNASQVGVSTIRGYGLTAIFYEPVYLMRPPGGDVVARFGLIAGAYPTFIDVKLRPDRDNALTATITNAVPEGALVRADTTIWGVPADPSHDTERQTSTESLTGSVSSAPRPPGGIAKAFMSNPTRCGSGKQMRISVTPWELPDLVADKSVDMPAFSGCDLLDFSPQIDLQPTSSRADSPSGMDVTLSAPQETLTDPGGRAEAHLKKTTVTLPEGMSLNPAAADGLRSCSESQIGLISESPIRFDASDPGCPDASKVGTAEITTPLLPDPIQGSLYVAEQGDNPFHTLLAGYLVAQGQGVTLKLAGRFDIDPNTGQITATFDNNPEQPFDSVKLHFKGGSRGVLITPPQCGTYEIESEFTPWSGTPPVTQTTTFTIDRGPGGGPCPNGAFEPKLTAGTTTPTAGAYSPFVFNLSREDGTQRFAAVSVTLPPGLTGKLAGIPPCSEAAIATAQARGGLGLGAGELSSPSCPAASQLGTTVVGAGAGSTPFYVSTGKVYLAGPYKSAPLSLLAVVPAVAGPFDLGVVVNRIALHVNPKTAQVSAVSDPIPTILAGIPLNVRDIRVHLDRPDFTLNPTSCEPMSVDATVQGEKGATAAVSDRFQVGGCDGLGFKPKLTLRLRGGTKRGAHPALTATLRNRAGDANIASVVTALPRSEFLENAHIRTVCTRADFAADNCPAGAIYGTAKVWTPLFDEPLTGNVYLRSSNNLLPDLVPDLRGPASLPIKIEAAGRTDSVNGGIRNSFDAIPDAPFSKLVLQLQGGRKGLLVNSRDICAHTYRATVRMTGHNGRKRTLRPKLKAGCGKKGKKAKRSSHRRAGRVG